MLLHNAQMQRWKIKSTTLVNMHMSMWICWAVSNQACIFTCHHSQPAHCYVPKEPLHHQTAHSQVILPDLLASFRPYSTLRFEGELYFPFQKIFLFATVVVPNFYRLQCYVYSAESKLGKLEKMERQMMREWIFERSFVLSPESSGGLVVEQEMKQPTGLHVLQDWYKDRFVRWRTLHSSPSRYLRWWLVEPRQQQQIRTLIRQPILPARIMLPSQQRTNGKDKHYFDRGDSKYHVFPDDPLRVVHEC